MNKILENIVTPNLNKFINKELLSELIRKSIHLSIGLTPLIASFFGRVPLMAFLGFGTLSYAIFETLRLRGVHVPLIGRITVLAMRARDKKGFVLGPITLGLGALLALFMYPEPASTVGLYALAFGDGLSSLVGKFFGTIRLPSTGGKTLEGSLAGFFGVYTACSIALPGTPSSSILIISFGACFLEMLPTRDFDNIIIPVGTGLLAYLVL